MAAASNRGRRVTADEREWERCVEDCDNRVARFERGDFYCKRHAPTEALKRLEERITMAVCDVNGVVTNVEMDEVERLRRIVGESWDAINRRWVALDEEAD